MLPIIRMGGGWENWLFCKLWFVCRLVWLANVPIVGWQNFKFFCAVDKKLKHEAVGCRVGKKSARWSVFIPVGLMSFVQV